MKIRTGFVSNSSSSSFVVLIPDDWTVTDKQIKATDIVQGEVIDPDWDKEAIDELIHQINGCVKSLKVGKCLYENDNSFVIEGLDVVPIMQALIPEKYIITKIPSNSGEACIIPIKRKKLEKMLKG